nr:hypothetical protein L203_02508 [Cryptococcus depauperatus CBS 7841]
MEALDTKTTSSIVYSNDLCLVTAEKWKSAAHYIANNLDRRTGLVEAEREGGFFDSAGEVWKGLAASFDPTAESERPRFASESSRLEVALALAKLERNLVAGLASFQHTAANHEEAIRQCIFHITSHKRIEDPDFIPLQIVITQLLSNIISPANADPSAAKLADKYLKMYTSGRREEDVIIRLLDSSDVKTCQATLHLLNNVTRNSRSRLHLLLCPIGVRWLMKVLGKMDDWLEKEDSAFDVAAAIFKSFIHYSLHEQLFTLLAEPSECITPSQTVFLKILDSTLSSTTFDPMNSQSNIFLVSLFRDVEACASPSLHQKADDPRLPKFLEALILVSEALSSIGLGVQRRRDKAFVSNTVCNQSSLTEIETGDEERLVVLMKDSKKGVVRPLISKFSYFNLLASLEVFFPRTNPLRPLPDPDHLQPAFKPFSKLKRNLLGLLSILTFNDVVVGDLVRECGGVELVLNLTEVDENNPFLREHALFCVRNLILDNPANQAIIRKMDPVGVLSETGELLPVPENMRKT